MSSNISVNVTIEPPDEYLVQEIKYDGVEVYKPPLSMSDYWKELAEKIDFTKFDDDTPDQMDDSREITDSKDIISGNNNQFQPSLWPWDSVRTKLRNALTEISVLVDVLNISKEKKYLVLDPVFDREGSGDRPVEYKPIAALIAKKKALNTTAAIILSGAERLRASIADSNRNRTADFNIELMQMRQNWRMKKLGNSIIGDLSYRSVGSRYPHVGTFEVTRNEASQVTPNGTAPGSSALKVSVPPDLEGIAYIHVTIQKSSETLGSTDLSIDLTPEQNCLMKSSWQFKLESAHNVLFCKELFSQLAREAVQVQLPIPTIVMGNQIIATLFPGIQLCIVLCHTSNSNPNKKLKTTSSTDTTTTTPASSSTSGSNRKEHKPVLEHSLHQLLRDVHYRALHHPMPHPITATLGVSRGRYLAGPEAHDKHTLTESCRVDTSLEQIIGQAQHVLLRIRSLHVMDTLAREVQDPLIIAHWMPLSSPTKSSVRVNIVSLGYESLCRTPLVIHIDSTSLKAICRDGRVFRMSYESQELRYLLLSQVSQHQVLAVHALAKMMGWKVLSFTLNCGVGPVEMIGTASSLLMASPNGERQISLRHGPESGVTVCISSNPNEQVFYPSTLVKDMKWQNVSGTFKEVALDRLEGRNLISKMEFLMAALTNS